MTDEKAPDGAPQGREQLGFEKRIAEGAAKNEARRREKLTGDELGRRMAARREAKEQAREARRARGGRDYGRIARGAVAGCLAAGVLFGVAAIGSEQSRHASAMAGHSAELRNLAAELRGAERENAELGTPEEIFADAAEAVSSGEEAGKALAALQNEVNSIAHAQEGASANDAGNAAKWYRDMSAKAYSAGDSFLPEDLVLSDEDLSINTGIGVRNAEAADPRYQWYLMKGPDGLPASTDSYRWEFVGLMPTETPGVLMASWTATETRPDGSRGDLLAWTSARWFGQEGKFGYYERGTTSRGAKAEVGA